MKNLVKKTSLLQKYINIYFIASILVFITLYFSLLTPFITEKIVLDVMILYLGLAFIGFQYFIVSIKNWFEIRKKFNELNNKKLEHLAYLIKKNILDGNKEKSEYYLDIFDDTKNSNRYLIQYFQGCIDMKFYNEVVYND